MKKVCVYVPAAKVKRLRDFAAKLRESDKEDFKWVLKHESRFFRA